MLVTYCSGDEFAFDGQLTKDMVASICKELSRLFGEGYIFEQEAITEGGILMKAWPGKAEHHYKTMRWYGFEWPWVIQGERWEGREDIIEKDRWRWGNRISTFLKAFHGAPCWSIDEIMKIRDVLSEFGFKLRSRMNKKNLKSNWKS